MICFAARNRQVGIRNVEIAEELGISPTSVSRHLLVLERTGILLQETEGAGRIYKLRDDALSDLISHCLTIFSGEVNMPSK